MFRSKEIKEKIKRIEDLKRENFNIPRMFYLEKNAGEMKVNEAYLWAQKINAADQQHIFNIRTYGHMSSTNVEQKSTPHITDLTVHQVYRELNKVNMYYYCMLDAEVPDDGRMAGNVCITTHTKNRFKKEFQIEFVRKEKRAMVRDINTEAVISMSGDVSLVEKILNNNYISYQQQFKNSNLVKNSNLEMYDVVLFVIKKAATFSRLETILEWTYFCRPAGILAFSEDKAKEAKEDRVKEKEDNKKISPETNVVWWEYRNYV